MTVPSPFRLLKQLLMYGAFVAVIGYFSATPAYRHMDPAMASIKLSFSHAGERQQPCRQLSAEELAALAANMRKAMDCPRERVPVHVELELDGEVLYRQSLPASGLARDGMSTAYARFAVAPGRYRLVARLRDTRRRDGYDYEHEEVVELEAQQNFVVDFRAETGGFVFN